MSQEHFTQQIPSLQECNAAACGHKIMSLRSLSLQEVDESDVWDLDTTGQQFADERAAFMEEYKLDTGTHAKFKVGQRIEFWTGENLQIRARASIKGITGGDLYVFAQCYWVSIQDDANRQIVIVGEN